MKKIVMFKQTACPYCIEALRYIEDLKQDPQYHNVNIEMIDEIEQPKLAAQYDYYYVPTFYMDGRKVHEGGISREKMEAILKEALR